MGELFMEKNDVFEDPEIPESLKAFAVSTFQLAAKDPRILLLLKHADKNKYDTDFWGSLYEELQDSENLERFSNITHKISNAHDWSGIEESYQTWGSYGWTVGREIHQLGFWDKCPNSQVEADKKVLPTINKKVLSQIQIECLEKTSNIPVFDECCKCFDNKCYTACATLLISLIDGELIRSKANIAFTNRKTGAIASKRVITEVSKDDMYGLMGLFHLELINYEAFLNTLFERANGFEMEPKRMNRNFIQHGMSKRKILRKDCIKLFLGYRNILFLIWSNSKLR